jgi:hypothetical protein
MNYKTSCRYKFLVKNYSSWVTIVSIGKGGGNSFNIFNIRKTFDIRAYVIRRGPKSNIQKSSVLLEIPDLKMLETKWDDWFVNGCLALVKAERTIFEDLRDFCWVSWINFLAFSIRFIVQIKAFCDDEGHLVLRGKCRLAPIIIVVVVQWWRYKNGTWIYPGWR